MNFSPTSINIFHGDCVAGMRQFVQSKTVDIVVTSPPYNLGISYRSYSDTLQWEEYLEWTDEWASEVRRTLKEDGSLFLNVGGSLKQPLLPHAIVQRLVQENEMFHLQNTIHWIKSIAMPGKDGEETRHFGHYKPINSDRFVNDLHEYIFHLTPRGDTHLDRKAVGVPYADKSNISRWGHTGGEDVKCRGNTWFIPYKTICNRAKDRPHPATFPTELAEQCIKLHGKNGDSVVMDPFLGIGHTAFAAVERHVASFSGFEIDGEYVKVAIEELKSMGASSALTKIKERCRS